MPIYGPQCNGLFIIVVEGFQAFRVYFCHGLVQSIRMAGTINSHSPILTDNHRLFCHQVQSSLWKVEFALPAHFNFFVAAAGVDEICCIKWPKWHS